MAGTAADLPSGACWIVWRQIDSRQSAQLHLITSRDMTAGLLLVYICGALLLQIVVGVGIANIRFTIAENKILPFLDALAAKDVTARLDREDLNISNYPRTIKRNGSLQITFVHNEPDLRRDVPAVPG